MSPSRVGAILFFIGLLGTNAQRWDLPDELVLLASLVGVVGLFAGPGLIVVGRLRRAVPATPEQLVWVACVGPILLAAIALLAWLGGGIVAPRLICRGAVVIVLGFCFFWSLSQPQDLRLSRNEQLVLVVFVLAVTLAAGRSLHALGVHGELYGGAVTKTMVGDNRSDPRVPYLIAMNVAGHWGPYEQQSAALYSPYVFHSRGPIAGLAATPAAMSWSREIMQSIDQMGTPFKPLDPFGYMQYRFSLIAFAALSIIPFFCLIGGTPAAVVASAVYALTPFFVHELYFTWAKQSSATLLLCGFCMLTARRFVLGGVLAGLAYLAHPAAAFTILAFPLVLVMQADWRNMQLGRLFEPRRWWEARRPLLASGLGLAAILGPWKAFTHGHFDSSSFADYVFMANGVPDAPIGTWLMSRVHSLASTVLPFYSYMNFSGHVIFKPFFVPGLKPVMFSYQWFYTLPAGVGLVWFVLRFTALRRAWQQFRGFLTTMILLPGAALLVYWGATSTGLMREGLHATFAFLMIAWCAASVDRSPTRGMQIARALELLLFIWLPTQISNNGLLSKAHRSTDILGLAMSLASTALLAWLALKAARSPHSEAAAP